jgi:hypothetical protein
MSFIPQDAHEASRHFNHACYHGLFDEALALLAQGTNPSWSGDSGKCGLHFAAMAGHADLCSFLASQHPETLEAKDQAGMTPLHLACRNSRSLAARALARAGAALDARDDFVRMPTECCPNPLMRAEFAQLETEMAAEQWAQATLTCAISTPSIRNFI